MKVATSPTIAGITKLINEYWLTDKYTIDPETLEILHPNKEVKDFKVVKKGNRYRFEYING